MRLLLVSGSVFPKSTSLADRYLILIPNIQRLVVQVCDLSGLFNKSYGFTNRKPPTSTANHQLQQPTTNFNSFHDVSTNDVLRAGGGVPIKTPWISSNVKAKNTALGFQRLKILGTMLPLRLWSLRTTFGTLLPWKHKQDHTLLEMSLTKYLLKFMLHVGLPACLQHPKDFFWITPQFQIEGFL